jgi:hypothetical protein
MAGAPQFFGGPSPQARDPAAARRLQCSVALDVGHGVGSAADASGGGSATNAAARASTRSAANRTAANRTAGSHATARSTSTNCSAYGSRSAAG